MAKSIADQMQNYNSMREFIQANKHYQVDFFDGTEITLMVIIVCAIICLIMCLLSDYIALHSTSSDQNVIKTIRDDVARKRGAVK